MEDKDLHSLLQRLQGLEQKLEQQARRLSQLEGRPEPHDDKPAGIEHQAGLIDQLEEQLLPWAYALSDAYDFDEKVHHPRHLEGRSELESGARLLAESALSNRGLLRFVGGGEHVMFGPMATEALRLRRAQLFEQILPRLPDLEERGLHFALAYLSFASGQPKIQRVLAQASSWWASNEIICESLRSFVLREHQGEESLSFGADPSSLASAQREVVLGLLKALDLPALLPLIRELSKAQKEAEDPSRSLLQKVGRFWGKERDEGEIIVEHAHKQQVVRRMEALLTGTSRRSVVLLGKHGVGKSVAIEQLWRRLQAKGWGIFEASAADVLAGQRYIGELEARVSQLLDALEGQKLLWYIPDFHELLDKGATQQDPTGILDLILPAMERQKVLVLGESRPEPYARLLREKHKLHYAVEAITLESADLESTVAMAREWAQRLEQRIGQTAVAPGVLEEAVQLSLQYFADRSLPGSIMQLLQLASLRKQLDLDEEELNEYPITVEDLLATIAQLTHLPASVLDDRQRLEIDALREHFRAHVIGQDEAIECLVDRIAMIKAGLTDPSRPLGVFLFAGPTGTGKTELGKTLCRFLFGSERHLIRLDMSEYHDRDSYRRLIHEGDSYRSTRSLASQINEQPFSVVLLDEVEKAHPQIWDLFLQVFDDGRLTDQSGNTVDFRHCIMILTSNVGSTIPTGSGVGFTAKEARFVPDSVHRAISQTFRREFVNRIDQVVVFHPLNRSVMRDILYKELHGLLQRRGFRSKDWEVEWGVSAVDFLLEKGFTPDLGARPLKRAIERYLLAPLAKTIVEHRFPKGNQFLFVHSDGAQIQVQFIDPDLPRPQEPQEEPGQEQERILSLKGIAFDAQGEEAELQFLRERWSLLQDERKGEMWLAEKASIQERMNAEDFLHARDRYQVLERLEVMDRIESGVESTGGQLRRLRGSRDLSQQRETLKRSAQQLFLLEIGARDVLRKTPQNAMIHISGLPSPELPLEASNDVFNHIKKMYQSWAEARRMRSMWLRRGSLQDMQAILVVSGLGAWSILMGEQGLHVFELPREDGSFHLTRVRVRVCPQPIEQPSSNQSILAVATDLFAQEEPDASTICRHYRWAPPPLVQDNLAPWRTTEIARVLGGDFDLIDGAAFTI